MVSPIERAFRDATAVVRRLRVPYMFAGGVAAIDYGSPYPTGDVDLSLLVPQRDAERVARALEGGGYQREHGVGVLTMVRGVQAIDLIPGPTLGTDREFDRRAFSRRRREEMYGARVWVTTPEDLVVSAMLRYSRTGSMKSLRHAQGIVQAGAMELDRGYIERWAGRHKTLGVWHEIRGGKMFGPVRAKANRRPEAPKRNGRKKPTAQTENGSGQ